MPPSCLQAPGGSRGREIPPLPPKCDFKRFPVGQIRKIRFHHLRHATASLLLMCGADLAAGQRIMGHQDPGITTEVYGHLSGTYLQKEIEPQLRARSRGAR